MSNYKIWLGEECSAEQAKHVLDLFEQLGYEIDLDCNKRVFEGGIFDSVYAEGTPFNTKSEQRARCSIHWHGKSLFRDTCLFYEITVANLEELISRMKTTINDNRQDGKNAEEAPDLEKLRSWISNCVTSKPQLNDKTSRLIVENAVEYLLDLLD